MGVLHLVRHGQASWGSDDYDALSELGVAQSTWLGTAWEAVDWMPTRAVAGAMRRHAQTAIAALDVAGPSHGYDVDEGWDEFDHLAVAREHAPVSADVDPPQFQRVLDASLGRWAAGDGAYAESYDEFVARVLTAFDRAASALGRGETGVVFTSGGPIALVVSHLLAGDDSIWRRLNAVVVNSSVTKIIVGSSGRTLVTFNEHGHLPADAITYR